MFRCTSQTWVGVLSWFISNFVERFDLSFLLVSSWIRMALVIIILTLRGVSDSIGMGIWYIALFRLGVSSIDALLIKHSFD